MPRRLSETDASDRSSHLRYYNSYEETPSSRSSPNDTTVNESPHEEPNQERPSTSPEPSFSSSSSPRSSRYGRRKYRRQRRISEPTTNTNYRESARASCGDESFSSRSSPSTLVCGSGMEIDSKRSSTPRRSSPEGTASRLVLRRRKFSRRRPDSSASNASSQVPKRSPFDKAIGLFKRNSQKTASAEGEQADPDKHPPVPLKDKILDAIYKLPCAKRSEKPKDDAESPFLTQDERDQMKYDKVKKKLVQWGERSTFHGVDILMESPSDWRRAFVVVFIAVMILFCWIACGKMVLGFLNMQIATVINQDIEAFRFPAVTICPDSPFTMEQLMKKEDAFKE